MRVELHVEGVGVVLPVGLHAPLAKGKRYFYHRPTRTPIDGIAVGTDGRFIATQAAIEDLKRLNAPQPAAKAGTLGALFDAWRDSIEFKALRSRTRADYEAVMAWLAPTPDEESAFAEKAERRARRAGKAAPPPKGKKGRLRDLALGKIDTPMVMGIRRKAFEAHKRRFANYCVTVISNAFAWGRLYGHTKANPAANIPAIKRPDGMAPANPPWNGAERSAALTRFRARARQLELPHLIGVYTGLREGDVIALSVRAWDGVTFRFKASKNGEERALAPPAPLRRALEAAMAQRTAREAKGKVLPMRLCLNTWGDGWTVDGFRASYFMELRALRAEGKLRPGRTFHSHRHGVGNALAEAGLSEDFIKAYLANRSSSAAQVYTRQAKQAGMVAAAATVIEQAFAGEEEDQ